MPINPDIPYTLTYKLSCLLSGIFLAYLGYKLFIKGFTTSGGEAIGEYKGGKIILKKAAPGTFFSVLGAFIICFTILKGMKSDVLYIIPAKVDDKTRYIISDSISQYCDTFRAVNGADSIRYIILDSNGIIK